VIHSIYSVARNINYLNQEAKVQFCPSSVLKETRHEPEELALPCGCIIGERYCDEAKRILASGTSMPRGKHGRQLPNDRQIEYYNHIAKGVKVNETMETV